MKRKTTLIAGCILFNIICSFPLTAQNTFPSSGSAGIGTTSPDASSLLEVKSTSKGVLVPRMTSTQRNAIVSPATGLLIYQTNSTPGFYYYTGTAWTAVTPKAKGWSLTGNSGTNPATNFLGTSDIKPLIFKVNNQLAGYLDNNSSNSTGFGYQALGINSSGAGNFAFGYQALYSNISGYQNVAIGGGAMYSNITGGYNVAVGVSALSSNSDGFSNTAVGQRSLYANTNGGFNTAIGFNSLYSNSTGSYNTASGDHALYSNVSGSENTGTGYQSLFSNAADYNTATGYQSLYANTTGHTNTASGVQSLYSNSVGSGNSAQGSQSLYSNTSGGSNTAIGLNALFSNSTASDNEGAGAFALYMNTSGSYNTANGMDALAYNTTAGYNTAVGFQALYSNDGTLAMDNTAVGSGSLYNNATGDDLTAVGENTEVNADGYSNSSAFGDGALITNSQQVRIGNSFVQSIGGYVNWSNVSDGRIKKNISQNVPGLAFINQLQPITYNLDLDAANKIVQPPLNLNPGQISPELLQRKLDAKNAKEKILYSGFIAQDVEKAAAAVGYDFSGIDAPKNDKDLYGLRYADFVVPLVKAVQELDKMNTEKDDRISNLQKQVDELKAEMGISNSEQGADAFAKIFPDGSAQTALLGQNIPNPFDNSTLIPFRIPKDCHGASIMITNPSTSEVISVIPVSCNEDHVKIDAGTLASGTYSYSLYVDGKMIDTKQLVLTR